MKDGWHTIKGYEVYVEDERILRGTVKDGNGNSVTAYPYRHNQEGGWDNASGVKVETFRKGNYCMR